MSFFFYNIDLLASHYLRLFFPRLTASRAFFALQPAAPQTASAVMALPPVIWAGIRTANGKSPPSFLRIRFMRRPG